MTFLISEEELMEATGHTQQTALERHLLEQAIRDWKAKGGRIYTVPAAFNDQVKKPSNETLSNDSASAKAKQPLATPRQREQRPNRVAPLPRTESGLGIPQSLKP